MRGSAGVRLLAGVLAAGMAAAVLAGCGSGAGSDDDATAGAGPSAAPTASLSATASPTGADATPSAGSPQSAALEGLTPAERQAFAEATDVVMAYRQTVTDLYSGLRTRVNDLDAVVTGDKLERSRSNVSKGLSEGYRSEPQGVQVILVSAEPVSVDLDGDPATVVVRACVDATAVTDVGPDGSRNPGVRDVVDYYVVRTVYLPDPGWAVLKEEAKPDREDRKC